MENNKEFLVTSLPLRLGIFAMSLGKIKKILVNAKEKYK